MDLEVRVFKALEGWYEDRHGHYTTINDTHGHPVGDEILRKLTGTCQRHILDILPRLKAGDSYGAPTQP